MKKFIDKVQIIDTYMGVYMYMYCLKDITACRKVSEFKILDILCKEILANCRFCSSMKTRGLEVCKHAHFCIANTQEDILASDFHQFAKFANISKSLT
jgi:hypothetical protein